MTIEIGRFEPVTADIVIGRLQAEGIAAFPLPSTNPYGARSYTGIMVDDADVDAARKIVAAGQADFPE